MTEEQKERIIKLLTHYMEESNLSIGRGVVVACKIMGVWEELEPRVRARAPELYEDVWPWW